MASASPLPDSPAGDGPGRALSSGVRPWLRARLVRAVRWVAVPIATAWLDRAVLAGERRARGRTRLAGASGRDARRRVRLLLMNAWGVGGTIRTTFNTADYLDGTHDVEVVSVFRNRAKPGISHPERVRVRNLFDHRRNALGRTSYAARLLRRAPSRLWHRADAAHRTASLWSDIVLLRWLRGLQPGTVVIATRPALIILASRFAPADVVVIGQEHQRLAHHSEELRGALAQALRNVSLMVTLTERDRREYLDFMGPDGAPVVAIPNAVPNVALGPGDPMAHRLIAAGRLVPQKGFDLLLQAFARVAPRHPDWNLDIYGRGSRRDALRRSIRELGLTGRAHLRKPTDRLGARMREASVYVLSSRYEGFPLVLLEAMAAGLAVVAFDCPTGPDEIVTPGVDGLLVPPKDVSALADALDRVMSDEALRKRLAAAAPNGVAPYRAEVIGRRWDDVLRAGSTVTRPSEQHAPRARVRRA